MKNLSLKDDKAFVSLAYHYLGIGRTKAIQLLHEEGCPYAVMVGKRLYANRKKLDAWIEENTGNA